MTKTGAGRHDPKLAIEVQRRLVQHINKSFQGNQSAFSRAVEVPRQTVMGWLQKEEPHLPNANDLVTVAKRSNLSLNWLLLGTEPWFRGELVHAGDIGTHLRSALETDLGREFGGAEHVAAVLPDGENLFALLKDLCREFVSRFPESATTQHLHRP